MKNTRHGMLMLILVALMCFIWVVNCKPKREVRIGVILDMDTGIGKMSNTCIAMAMHDFYEKHNTSTMVLRTHLRDAKQDDVQAASAAMDLMKNVQVAAILGPTTSSQADFIIGIGNKSKVPVISPATSPSLSPKDNMYFIRSAHGSDSQLEPIAELIKYFNWSEVVFAYEDDEYGRGLVPYFSDAMVTISTKVMYQVGVPPSASDDWILGELYKLKTMQTRVFVVHVLPELASRFFNKVNEAGMMEEGYVWIITEVLTGRLHSLDHMVLDSMNGVLGVKSYIPRSNKLIDFQKRWKREFRASNLDDDETELDMFGIWWYDTVYGLAMALEKVGNEIDIAFTRKQDPLTDLDAIGTLEMGSRLIPWIRNINFKGLSGDFSIIDGQLQSSVYQIVSIIGTRENLIGFWSRENGMSKKLNHETKGLRAITWPGDSHDAIPKGWEIPTSNKHTLKIGVPAKGSFAQFVDSYTNPETKQVKVTGFCVDVFNAVIDALPYAVKHDFVPFVTPDGERPAGSYNDLIRNLSIGKYDAVVGDVTILVNRWDYVDFTFPYTEAGVSLIVPFVDQRKSAWIFVRPVEASLWTTTCVFFIYTGFVVWVLEHRVNKEFHGPAHRQVGMIFWFSFSTLVYAHREKLISNLSRFVVIVWVFVVLVLTSSYTASLTSMLTVERLRPTHTDINQIMKNGESVGYQHGSFVVDILKSFGFDDSKLKGYSTFEEYDSALQAGSQNGGVSAIMDELPYIRLFLAIYCNKYTTTSFTYQTAGFGFAFPKGSPLLHDVSKAVLQVTEEKVMNISSQWFVESANCTQQNGAKADSGRLMLESFKGPFLIAGVSSTSALLIFVLTFLYQNRQILVSQDPVSRKLVAMAKTFDVFMDDDSRKTRPKAAVEEFNSNGSPEVHGEEEFSTTEPVTPVNGTLHVLEITS
ncbi:glutamate receptor 2.7-like [Bidens hawaiensis]|uniref:glutamate receptor 2.7-like n=1 Tax=Bidens hawaiensis TaxID=980011 RepID=UPI00404979DD